MGVFKLGLIGKNPPGKFKAIMDHLTRVKKKKSDLPDVFFASEAPIPPKTQTVEEMEAINAFIKRERQQQADGGMLVQPSADGSRPGYRGKSSIDPKLLNSEAVRMTGGKFKTWDSITDKTLRENVRRSAKRREQGASIGKGRPGVKKDYKTISPMKNPKVVEEVIKTRKKTYQASPEGIRLQWIADNSKDYDTPDALKKAYEKHFKHKVGSKADALFNIEKKPGTRGGAGSATGKKINFGLIDGLQNFNEAERGNLMFIKKGFSEDELFKAAILQNNPKVQTQFKNLFKDIHNNVSLYSELGPEGIVERLKSQGGNLLEDFDFIKSYSSGGQQTYGGVHRGITRNSLLNLGIPEKHIVSYQTVRKPLQTLEQILIDLKNRGASERYGISNSTAFKIASQLDNFLKGQGNIRKDIATIDKQLGDVKFKQIFGGVNFEHTLAKRFGKDYKYLPRNYLLKGQFTSAAFNQIKKQAFDLPLIDLMKKYEQGKVSGAKVQEFIDDFNAKTNNYADFNFDIDKGRLAYSDNAVKYDLSRYANPDVARQELIKNIDLTMSSQFQKGFKNLPVARDKLKLFKSKDAKNIRNLLAKIGCPGKGKAYGGRIEFQEGLSPEVCMTRGAQVIQEKRIDSPAQKANFNKMMKVASVGKNMALLKDVLGPYGLGGDVLLEGMIAVNKTLTGGTPFKESWQDSWLSNIVGGAYDEAGQKLGRQKLFELRSDLSSGAQEFGDYNRKLEEYYKLIEQKNNLEAISGGSAFDYVGNLSSDVRQINNKIKIAERELNRMETRINAQGGFNAAENEYNRKTAERIDADAATSLQSIGRRFVEDNQLNEMLRDDFSGLSSDALPMQKEPRSVLANYETFKPEVVTLPQYKDMFKEAGITPPDDRVLEQNLNQERFRQLFEQPGFMGASDTFFGDTVKMAGGGIAKLAGVDSGPPPASGPNSQGLQGLMKRVRNF